MWEAGINIIIVFFLNLNKINIIGFEREVMEDVVWVWVIVLIKMIFGSFGSVLVSITNSFS